jgi:hypothetical protein
MLEVNEQVLFEGPFTELYAAKYGDKDVILKIFKSSEVTDNDAYDFERECEFLRFVSKIRNFFALFEFETTIFLCVK